jgi:hypothetical protein
VDADWLLMASSFISTAAADHSKVQQVLLTKQGYGSPSF